MEIIIWIIVIFVIYWIFQKVRHSTGIVWQIVYNEEFWLKPYSQYDMKLKKIINEQWWKLYMREVIVFKWYLTIMLLSKLWTIEYFSMKTDELNIKLKEVYLNWFWTELKQFKDNEIIERFNYYGELLLINIDVEQIEYLSEEKIHSLVFEFMDYERSKSISSLLLKWELDNLDDMEYVKYAVFIDEYIRRHLYMSIILTKNFIKQPEMLRM
jgi:hypothetical protein